jgi:hypothetical protein
VAAKVCRGTIVRLTGCEGQWWVQTKRHAAARRVANGRSESWGPERSFLVFLSLKSTKQMLNLMIRMQIDCSSIHC